MILIDYSAITIGTFVTQGGDCNEDLLRHMILNNIRTHRNRHTAKYGEVVLCCDGANNWRRTYYPQYKYKRREGRKQSKVDWNAVFEMLNRIQQEIHQYMPYKMIEVEGAEGDDVIATLVEYTQEFGNYDEVMIVSSDKDFLQLQRYKNVAQWSLQQKRLITEENPLLRLREHVLKGDAGDGVPNVMSDDDCFVSGRRQTPLSKGKMRTLMEDPTAYGEAVVRNIQRNAKLIDLSKTPQNIKDKIINRFETVEVAPTSAVLPYLINKRCRNLIDVVGDFTK